MPRREVHARSAIGAGRTLNTPVSHSAATVSRPLTMVAASSSVSTPAFASARAYAWLPCDRCAGKGVLRAFQKGLQEVLRERSCACKDTRMHPVRVGVRDTFTPFEMHAAASFQEKGPRSTRQARFS